MRHFIFLQFILLAWLGTSTTASSQQPPELSVLYGRGVHSYFANQTSRAEQQFTKVIDAGSTDPRVYYFRGMARLRMGLQAEAQSDMRTGAVYEARRPGDQAAVSKSLQRVQGSGRLMLEQFRREARLTRAVQRRRQSRLRYEHLKRREVDVLRHQVDLPLDQLIAAPANIAYPTSATEEKSTEVKANSSQETDPPIEQPGISPAPNSTGPVANSADPVANFKSSVANTTGQNLPSDLALPTDTSDPFGDAEVSPPAAQESEPADRPQPEVPAGEDPFDQPEPPSDTSDPFGDAEVSPPASQESEPADRPQPEVPAGEDPFDQPEPASDTSDPFGESLPSSPADGGAAETTQFDVFGEPVQSTSTAKDQKPVNEGAQAAKSKGKQALNNGFKGGYGIKGADNRQGADQKRAASRKTRKAVTPTGKVKSGSKTAGNKATGKQSTAPADVAPKKSNEISSESKGSTESADGENGPVVDEEDDPFGGF